MLTVQAPAKINLVLEVLERLDDYHRIASIVQSIDLCDTLDFHLDEEIHFECDRPGLEHDNLVVQAAEILRASTRYSLGARIKLHKRIPWGSGLGGGSSDAAATLLALNELWRLELPVSGLIDLASRLGSDVPFFIHGGTALVQGRGERVTPLPGLPPTWFILLVPSVPEIPGKTKQMYGKLDFGHFTDGRFVEAAVSALRRGTMIDRGLMFNVFERVAFGFFPQLDGYRKLLEEAGAPAVHLAGSGPCLFALCAGREEAADLFSRLNTQGLECHLAACFSGGDVSPGG